MLNQASLRSPNMFRFSLSGTPAPSPEPIPKFLRIIGGVKNASPLDQRGIGRYNPMFSREERVELFMSLFRGRNDVFARRWEK